MTTAPTAADGRDHADLTEPTTDSAASASRPPGGACWPSTSTGPRQPTAHATGDDPTTATPPGRGRIRTVQRDGTVVWTTPILEYDPALTGQDYDVLARLRDQARAHMARQATDLSRRRLAAGPATATELSAAADPLQEYAATQGESRARTPPTGGVRALRRPRPERRP